MLTSFWDWLERELKSLASEKVGGYVMQEKVSNHMPFILQRDFPLRRSRQ